MQKFIFLVFIAMAINLNAQNWVSVPLATAQHLNDIDFSTDSKGWIVGNEGTIFTYDGNTWQALLTDITQNLSAVYMIDADDVWIVGDSGLIVNYRGGEFIYYNGITTEYLSDIHMVDSMKGWITGDHATLLVFDGVTWKQDTIVDQGGFEVNDLYELDFIGDSLGMAVGHYGSILKYEGAWTNLTDQNTVHFSSVCIKDANHIMVGRYQGTPLDNWHDILSFTEGVLYSNPNTIAPVSCIDLVGDQGWAVSRAREILEYNGSDFTLNHWANQGLNGCKFLNDSLAWIVGDNGTLLKQENTSGIEDISQSRISRVYPNPVRTSINIDTGPYSLELAEVLSTDGRKIWESMQFDRNNGHYTLDLQSLRPGMYILRLTSGLNLYHCKIVKL